MLRLRLLLLVGLLISSLFGERVIYTRCQLVIVHRFQ